LEFLAPIHATQVITCLGLSGRRIGLFVNFGEASLKNGIKRLINGYDSWLSDCRTGSALPPVILPIAIPSLCGLLHRC